MALAVRVGMTTTAQIDGFLACKRIGLAGVSSNPDDFSRTVFRELRARGYEVIPIHPTADEIEGVRAFATVCDAAPLDGVYIMTPRSATASIVHDCHRAGVWRVWVHRGVGGGAVDREATAYAHAHKIEIVDGECIHMFLAKAHAIHRAHLGIRRMFGHYPEVSAEHPAHRWVRAIGHGMFAWALAAWVMIGVIGVLDMRAGLATRLLVVPAVFALTARLHARPGAVPPLAMAICFTSVAIVLDALLVHRLDDLVVTWIPFALGFVAAVAAATHYQQPLRVARITAR